MQTVFNSSLRRRARVMALAIVFTLAARANGVPTPQRGAQEEVAAILAEMQLPALQTIAADLNPRKLLEDHALTLADLKEYVNAGPTFADIRQEPEKYAKEFPVRVAVVEAVAEVRKLGMNLPDSFRDPVTDQTKKNLTDKYQRTLAEMQGILDELDDKMTEVAKKRNQEKSKRWLAHFDTIQAQIQLRQVWCQEYNLALGHVKTDKLAPLDGLKQNGWRLIAREKMLAPVQVRTLAADAKKRLVKIAQDYPKTPWALLADKQKDMFLGLEWEAAEIGD
jgi:hypothetical protein